MPAFQDPEIYRDILNRLQIGVSVMDLQEKIVFWSDGAERITGYARLDVLGHRSLENILQHCNREGCEMCAGRCPLAACLHDVRPVESVTRSIHHRSGHWIPVHSWCIPLRDKHGSIIGVIQTFEREFAVMGPDPNDRCMKERGCLDSITSLPNHVMMQSHLRETLGTFAELKIPFGLVCLEVQDLAQFRARYGQEAGSCLLRVVARTLKNSVWATDFVGRWSDERFLVILSGCDEEALRTVSQRLWQVTGSTTIEWWGQELSAAILMESAGVGPGDTAETLLQRIHQAFRKRRVEPAAHTAVAAADSRPAR